MLIGVENNINRKLAEEINKVIPVHIVDFQNLLEDPVIADKVSSQVIFVNLIDVGNQERLVYKYLKEHYPNTKIVAFHYYQAQSMIHETLKNGYDGYVSIIKFSDKFHELLDQLSIIQPPKV